MAKELNEQLHSRIASLSKDGDDLLSAKRFTAAVALFQEAWALLPEPKDDWDAATWILSAIGDAHFLSKQYDRALETLGKAVRCPGGLGNPFIHLRLGESAYELGHLKRADEELTRAYMAAGNEIFKTEDPKYFLRLKGILKPPPGSHSL